MTVDIDQLVEHLPVAQAREVKRAYRRQAKDETAAFLWCFFLGTVGAHRLYLRQWTRALLHIQVLVIAALVVIAGIIANLPPLLVVAIVAPFVLAALIWSFIDLAHIDDEVSERNLQLAEHLVAAAMLADPAREAQAETLLRSAAQQTATSDAATLAEQYTPEREAPAPLDVGVQAMTGVAALGIGAGYRAVAEPAREATPSRPAPEPIAEPVPEPVVEPTPTTPAWQAAAQPEVPDWDTPTPPPTYIRTPAPTATSPTRDFTDLGGDLGPVAPIADIELNGPWLLTPSAPDNSSSPADAAEDVGLLTLVPEPEPAPPIWPAAPAWPAADEPPEWPAPASPYAEEPASYAATPAPAAPTPAPASADDPGGITQDMLADAAGLAAAGGMGAMSAMSFHGASESAPDAAQTYPAAPVEPEPAQPTPQHLLKHIRVVRQVKVGNDVVEETVAEAYIDPDEDPEPVRERLREQLRLEAEAKQSNS